jgi:dTDP-4-amino-4,6-dideoxy-D-galactose acyltransferase
MELLPATWDTVFFGYPVGKVNLSAAESIDPNLFINNPYKLIYFFSSVELHTEQIHQLPLKLVDCKVELLRNVDDSGNHVALEDSPIKLIKELTPELFNLVLQSGHYSRFKLDSQFKDNEFERLYLEWINKTLQNPNEQVLVYEEAKHLMGFITLGIKINKADIGLIAVDEQYRGKSIGKKLLKMANQFELINGKNEITVVTQLENKEAMRFYEQNGFYVYKKSYIYHLWKK